MSVELLDYMGNDLAVVNAARVSYGKESRALTEADKGLIRFLVRERHGSPFEHVVFTFRVEAPIFVTREWMRHRIGSFNERSGRYTTFELEYHFPAYDEWRTQIGKPGSYAYSPIHDEDTIMDAAGITTASIEASFKAYDDLLALGIAKEQARIVLPVAMLTQFVWTVNFRSLTNFLSLRTAPNAQLEIRREAEAVEELIRPIVPECWAAWNEFGRKSL